MALTKVEVSQGIKREIERLNQLIRALRDKEIFVRDGTDANLTNTYEREICDCALELERLRNELDSLHIA